MKTQLSGIRDVDRVILSKVDDKELLKVCSIDKYTWNTVCDDNFLKRRLSKYPKIEKYKLEKENWKKFFLRAVNYIALMKEEFTYDYTFGDFKKQYDLLNVYNISMNQLLIYSAKEGELALVIWCLNNGIDIHADYNIALRLASENGYYEVVRYLVEHGANIHAGDDRALGLASLYGHYEVVRYLVEHGADIHAYDGALGNASYNGHYEVVRYLVEHGANIHADNDRALLLATNRRHPEVVNYLKSLFK